MGGKPARRRGRRIRASGRLWAVKGQPTTANDDRRPQRNRTSKPPTRKFVQVAKQRDQIFDI